MKKIFSFISFLLIITLISCNNDDNTIINNSKGVIDLEFDGNKILFKDVKVGNLKENNEIIGKFISSNRKVGDSLYYKVEMFFKKNSESSNKYDFLSMEFTPYKKLNNGSTGLQGNTYLYTLENYPFNVTNISFNNDSLKGDFNGYLFSSTDDPIRNPPIYIKNGYFNFKIE